MTAPFPVPPAPSRPGFSLARLGRLVSKELRESLRDRRTIVTLILMPLLLYPLLGMIFFLFFRFPLLAMQKTVYRIGFRNEEEMISLLGYLSMGEQAMLRDQGFDPPLDLKAQEEGPGPSDRAATQDSIRIRLPFLEFSSREDLDAEVVAGHLDMGLRRVRQQGLTTNRLPPDGNQMADWEVVYLAENAASREAVRYFYRVAAAANGEYLGRRLKLVAARQRIPPVRLELRALTNPEQAHYSILGALLPLILVLMTITGAVYPAIDLTAGERERGTLEILMAAPIPRLSVLLAKYVAVLTVALLTALINLAMMTFTLLALGGGPFLFTSGFAILLIMIEVLGLLLLFAAFFSAVLLSLTSLTRSFKEAQAYLIPLMLVAITPGLLSLVPGLKLEGIYPLVPLLNIVLLARDLLDGTAQPLAGTIVVAITFLYGLGALVLAARIFGRSAVAGA